MSNLAWVDTETTGLDPNVDSILEIALVITDPGLHVLSECSLVIDQGDDVEKLINRCDNYVAKMHTGNGLFEAMLTAPDCTISDAEQLCVALMQEHHATDCLVNGESYRSPMCGSTVSFDRGFLRLEMPKLTKCFSYRHVDVSSLVELVRRWYPGCSDFEQDFPKHRALPDIQYSIQRLNHFRHCYFNNSVQA